MRSLWKVPYINSLYFQKYFLKKRIYKIKYKNSSISSNFIDKKVRIYDGRFVKTLNINNDMVGYKFGEFIFSKISMKYTHLKKSKKKSKRIKKK